LLLCVLIVSAQNFRHGQFESYIYEMKAGTHVICYGKLKLTESFVHLFHLF